MICALYIIIGHTTVKNAHLFFSFPDEMSLSYMSLRHNCIIDVLVFEKLYHWSRWISVHKSDTDDDDDDDNIAKICDHFA